MSPNGVADGYAELAAIWFKAGLEAAAAACAARAERHAKAAQRLLPGTAAIAFMDLRGEATACERAVRELAGQLAPPGPTVVDRNQKAPFPGPLDEQNAVSEP